MSQTLKIGLLMAGNVPDDLSVKYDNYEMLFEDWLLEEPGLVVRAYDITTGEWPKNTAECDGWIISGSATGAYEDHDWIKPLEAFVRKCVALKSPLLGVCFGHQLMAQALGGKVEKSDKGWGAGVFRSKDSTGKQLSLLYMHQDQVVTAPRGAKILWSHDFCPIAALQLSQTAISVQGHPEFTAEYTADLINARKGTRIPEDVADRGLASLEQNLDGQRVRTQFLTMVRQAAKPPVVRIG